MKKSMMYPFPGTQPSPYRRLTGTKSLSDYLHTSRNYSKRSTTSHIYLFKLIIMMELCSVPHHHKTAHLPTSHTSIFKRAFQTSPTTMNVYTLQLKNTLNYMKITTDAVRTGTCL
jgi:hypothetical protein